MNGFSLKTNSGWQNRVEPERVICSSQSAARFLATVLAGFLIALRVYGQTPVSPPPGGAETVPTPAATASPGETTISFRELAQKPEKFALWQRLRQTVRALLQEPLGCLRLRKPGGGIAVQLSQQLLGRGGVRMCQ